MRRFLGLAVSVLVHLGLIAADVIGELRLGTSRDGFYPGDLGVRGGKPGRRRIDAHPSAALDQEPLVEQRVLIQTGLGSECFPAPKHRTD